MAQITKIEKTYEVFFNKINYDSICWRFYEITKETSVTFFAGQVSEHENYETMMVNMGNFQTITDAVAFLKKERYESYHVAQPVLINKTESVVDYIEYN